MLYNVAFLLMGLHGRDLDRLDNTVLNRYLDVGEESDGLIALPLFLSVRAAVRAHVDAASAERQGESGARRQRLASARHYFAEAIELLRPRSARLIAIGGLSGTGKSTLAFGLAPGIGAVPGARVLRTDVIRKRLAGLSLTERLPPTAYIAEASRRVYVRLIAEIEAVLAAGHSAIADAVFARPEERKTVQDLAHRAGVRFSGLWLEAPAKFLAERVESRTADASDATKEVLSQQLAYDLGAIDWPRVDAVGSPEAVLTRARAVMSPISRRSAERRRRAAGCAG